MKKIIKLKIRNAEGVLVEEGLVSCSVEEGYKKEYQTVFNKQGKCWRCFVKINIGDEEIGDDFIHYQDTFKTLQGAVAAVQKYVDEWFKEFRVTTM